MLLFRFFLLLPVSVTTPATVTGRATITHAYKSWITSSKVFIETSSKDCPRMVGVGLSLIHISEPTRPY